MLRHLQKQHLGFIAAIEPGEKNLQLYKFAQSLNWEIVQICTLRLNLLINFLRNHQICIHSIFILRRVTHAPTSMPRVASLSTQV